MPDFGEKKGVDDAKAKSGREEAGRRVVWATLLSDVRGREFCWWLLGKGNIYSSTFRGEDTHRSAFAEGARALMIPIQGEMIRSHPGNYLKMVLEHAAQELITEIEDGRSDTGS